MRFPTMMIVKIVIGLFAVVASADPPCVTYSTLVTCGECPNPPLYQCWDAAGWNSYMVGGTRLETWCNWSYDDGWCTTYAGCTTVSSISTAEDCNGYVTATQRTICCVAP